MYVVFGDNCMAPRHSQQQSSQKKNYEAASTRSIRTSGTGTPYFGSCFVSSFPLSTTVTLCRQDRMYTDIIDVFCRQLCDSGSRLCNSRGSNDVDVIISSMRSSLSRLKNLAHFDDFAAEDDDTPRKKSRHTTTQKTKALIM